MRSAALTCLFILCSLVYAHAQTAANQPIRRVEVAVGAGLFGGAHTGEADANLRANSSTPTPYRVFTTDTRFAPARLLEGRAGLALTRRYAVEARFAVSHPELRTSVGDDAEGAPALTVGEQVDQYLFDAALIVMLDEWRVAGLVPFASAGAGYLRQLHEGHTLVEEGHVFHVGGGIKHWLFARRRGALKGAGLRADGRLYLLRGGIASDAGPRPHGAISGSLFVAF